MMKLLIVDDEQGSREALRLIFSHDYAVLSAATAEEAQKILAREQMDLVLLDVVMPGRSGLDLLRQIRADHPDLPVIMVSASTAIPAVVEAIRLRSPGVIVEVLVPDFQGRLADLDLVLQAAPDVFGHSPCFVAATGLLRQAAAADATVLIQGESGTGKELAARLLHEQSPRRDEPFVAVHCAALPENLLESELFGHEKGAFTGADRQKPGRFELAGSGTLFFDEIGEMSAATQVKLLRVLQEREFMRVGGTRTLRTSARIVAATARDLRVEAAAGRFREDLFYRLNVVQIRLPPLRERRDDIPLLLAHFLGQLGPALHAGTRAFDAEALRLLCAYDWPGNVRELRNVVERVLVLHGREPTVSAARLPEEFHAAAVRPAPALPAAAAPGAPGVAEDVSLPADGQTLDEAVGAFERRIIAEALRQAGGVQTRAAQRLGSTRRILRYKMAKLGLAEADPSDNAVER